MVKLSEEPQLARHAETVGMAMMNVARETIGDGVPEYEVAAASSQAGTRATAALLKSDYNDPYISPNIHFLQIMASGREITKPHHRASTHIMKYREPVFMCFATGQRDIVFLKNLNLCFEMRLICSRAWSSRPMIR